MINEVQAKLYSGPAERGVSGGHYFLCDDDNEYLVKFNRSDRKTVINELVAGMLATTLDLPVPKIVLVNFTEEFLAIETDELKNIRAGKHIGIKRLTSAWDFCSLPDEKLWANLTNESDLYGVVSFDNWVINPDRNNRGNNMLEILGGGNAKYWMIDFGHCFLSNNWTHAQLSASIPCMNLVGLFWYMKEKITSMDGFLSWFSSIENMSQEQIKEIVDDVPDSWPLDDDEKMTLINFLASRRKLVKKIIWDRESEFDVDN